MVPDHTVMPQPLKRQRALRTCKLSHAVWGKIHCPIPPIVSFKHAVSFRRLPSFASTDTHHFPHGLVVSHSRPAALGHAHSVLMTVAHCHAGERIATQRAKVEVQRGCILVSLCGIAAECRAESTTYFPKKQDARLH